MKKYCAVNGDNLAGVLHVLWLQVSPPLPASLAAIKPANPVSPGKIAVKMARDSTVETDAKYSSDMKFTWKLKSLSSVVCTACWWISTRR